MYSSIAKILKISKSRMKQLLHKIYKGKHRLNEEENDSYENKPLKLLKLKKNVF